MSHYKNICQHGHVHGQCRCAGPKEVKRIDCPSDLSEELTTALALAICADPHDAEVELKEIVCLLSSAITGKKKPI